MKVIKEVGVGVHGAILMLTLVHGERDNGSMVYINMACVEAIQQFGEFTKICTISNDGVWLVREKADDIIILLQMKGYGLVTCPKRKVEGDAAKS